MQRSYPVIRLLMLLALALLVSAGCRSGGDAPNAKPSDRPLVTPHRTTAAIDAYSALLAPGAQGDTPGPAARSKIYADRWRAVQRAVAHHGTTHRDAFYASRSYWHANSTRGIGWALDQRSDLDDAYYVDGKGNVLIAGDVNADIEIAGNAIVHILGDLNATLELKGLCEVVIAGKLTRDATIVCDGQLELFVGGDSAGILGATGTATIIIDGNAAGTVQSGSPAAVLTITGDLTGQVVPPKKKDALLTLRVDGFASTQTMLDFAGSTFTRVNATIGVSNVPPGLYPANENPARPVARWVVLREMPQ